MIGALNFEGNSKNIIDLTIYDIIKHLSNIDKISFTSAKITKNDYFDVVIQKFDQTCDSDEEVDKVTIPLFIKNILKIFNDSQNKEKLIALGATDIDFALINNDKDAIKRLAHENEKTNSCDLARDYRLLKLAKEIHKENCKAGDFDLTIDGHYINLYALNYYAFEYCSKTNQEKTLLINIHDIGHKAWNYNDVKIWSEVITPYFDTIIAFGNGANCILPQHILKLLNIVYNSLNNLELDFAMILYHGHGPADEGQPQPLSEIINKFPVNFAKETLYAILACSSGEYHFDWNNKCSLITSAKGSESSSANDFGKIANLSKYITNSPNTQSFINFFANEYEKSEPHFSGQLNGEEYENKSVKEIATTNSVVSTDFIPKEHEFVEVIDLLGVDPSPLPTFCCIA